MLHNLNADTELCSSLLPVEYRVIRFWGASCREMPSETTLFVFRISGAAELRRGTSKFALEHAVEGCFRCIADRGGDLADVRIGRHKPIRSQLEPPPCEIRHGRLAQKVTKALGESGARNPDLMGEVRDGPMVSRVFVEQRERFADHGIACSPKPSLVLIRQVLNETPQSFDEKNFR